MHGTRIAALHHRNFSSHGAHIDGHRLKRLSANEIRRICHYSGVFEHACWSTCRSKNTDFRHVDCHCRSEGLTKFSTMHKQCNSGIFVHNHIKIGIAAHYFGFSNVGMLWPNQVGWIRLAICKLSPQEFRIRHFSTHRNDKQALNDVSIAFAALAPKYKQTKYRQT